MHTLSPHHRSALIGLLFSLPFVLANAIIGARIEPLYSYLSSIPLVLTSTITPVVLLLFLPPGAFIAARPMLQARKFFILNSVIAFIMMAVFVLLFSLLAGDLYRCDILQIPNCD